MSTNLNIEWLRDNLNTPNLVIFDIGAADLSTSLSFRKYFPEAQIHAFECSDYWISRYPILELAKNNNIVYNQTAVSDKDEKVIFFQSDKNKEENWPQSGSLFKPTNVTSFLSFYPPKEVNSIRLDTFCKKNTLHPTFIHVDAQGAEFAIFSSIGKYKPNMIWTEISEFEMYDTKCVYKDFNNLLIDLGYEKIIRDGPDELYVLEGTIITDYIKRLPK